MAASLKVSWDEIRKCSEMGMSDGDIAEEYGITSNAIIKHRYDDKRRGKPWITPKEIKLQAEIERAKQEAEAQVRKKFTFSSGLEEPHSNEALLDAAKDGRVLINNKPAEVVLAEKLLKDGETASKWAMEILLEKLGYAKRHPETIAKLESVQDVNVALGAARKAAGMDKPQAQIALSFGSGWAQPKDGLEGLGRVVDV